MKFARLTAIRFVGRDARNNARWLFQCECGKEYIGTAKGVKTGDLKSCGCLRRELNEKARGIAFNRSHGMTGSAEYRIWAGMLQRCTNSAYHGFDHYGGRGIKVCPEWTEFESFYADMGNRPSPKHSIERVDVNGDYEPKNCTWTTHTGQMRNRTTTIYVQYLGRQMSLGEAAELSGVKYKNAWRRIFYRGWSVRRALTP